MPTTPRPTSPGTPGRVVVAVSPRGSRTAIEYAAIEAQRRRTGLHMVHATGIHDTSTYGPELLEDAVRHASRLMGELPVTAEVMARTGPVAAVAAVASDATLVVVGRRPSRDRFHARVRTLGGGLGGRLDAPVVTVPDHWEPGDGADRIVVGIDESQRARDVLVAALEAAVARDARVTVLSSWWRPLGAVQTPLTHVTDPAHGEQLEQEIVELVGAVRAADGRYRGVDVDVEVQGIRPEEALLRAGREAELLVLGRHATLVPSGSHLGPVARAVVREAACPVLLAAPAAHHGMVSRTGAAH